MNVDQIKIVTTSTLLTAKSIATPRTELLDKDTVMQVEVLGAGGRSREIKVIRGSLNA